MYRGIPASRGMSMGRAVIHQFSDPAAFERTHDLSMSISAEKNRIVKAVGAVCSELDMICESLEKSMEQKFIDIFRTQKMILNDPNIHCEMNKELESGKSRAEDAVRTVFLRWEALFRSLDRSVIQDRADDIVDASRRLMTHLLGKKECTLPFCDDACILITRELLPSEVVLIHERHFAGVVLSSGSPDSHAAIIMRELGIPCVVKALPSAQEVPADCLVLLDAVNGQVLVDPTIIEKEQFQRSCERFSTLRKNCREARKLPSVTRCGIEVSVFSNISGLGEAATALENGACGIGLLRIENLFLARHSVPGDEELYNLIRDCIAPFAGREIVLRLLDLGGDKNIAYLNITQEENPFLGRRGIRLLLARLDLLRQQLRVFLRVNKEIPIRIMIPMVTFADEVKTVRDLLQEVALEEGCSGIPPLGAMVETPAAALAMNTLLPMCDFFSVGTNDLIQYTLAAGRTNSSVTDLRRRHHPALWRLLRTICSEAGGKSVTLCGELAADPDALPMVLKCGIRSLSMASPMIPEIKERIRGLEI
ncbi:MAG: phosphoenolpyruvate--protein phosphotransferase [Candidatus Wallbacteria bacterium]|nr:phosphoenolpyruvate--protein phosphotransferase [Candidatus Wallbacteria bacterium]